MDRQTAIRSAPLRDLLPVRSLNDLDWFVKESEVITGNPGRESVVAGADQPTFRIHLDHVGYQICGEQAAAPVSATAPELVQHALGDALARGQLFTTALQRAPHLQPGLSGPATTAEVHSCTRSRGSSDSPFQETRP